MYDGTSTEQKTKNAKNAVSSILTAFFNPTVPSTLRVATSPFNKSGGIIRLNTFGVFQELYRQQKANDIAARLLFIGLGVEK